MDSGSLKEKVETAFLRSGISAISILGVLLIPGSLIILGA